MTHADVGRALRIFDDVVDLPADARAQALDTHCRDQPTLRQLVERMLSADGTTAGPVQTGAADALIAADLAQPSVPEQLGHYRIVRALGSGGMGAVYEATEERPRRTVAIKTIHPWLVSDQTRGWLEAEAEALGAVVHPGVPQVYAVGEDQGVLYVAMERVAGVDLLAASRTLPPRRRVALVRDLCDTVAHIHGRGLVHRDLKPANVCVTPEGVPKLLDFGLARSLQRTDAPPVAGTLPYMAPEHLAGGAPPDVRADVYAMGVILYEVLAGRLPDALRGLGFAEARTRVQELDWAAACATADLDGDLTAIVRAATARDPRERYATVEELGRELSRYRAYEPVLAREGGVLYAASKLLTRRPMLVGAALVAALALLGTSVVSVVAARRAAADAREQAALRAAADVEAARARAFGSFVEEVVLRANPRRATGERTLIDVTRTAGDALDEGGLAEHPVERARLRAIVAETLFNVGDLDAATAQLESIRASWKDGSLPDGPEVVDALHGLSAVARRRHQLDEATVTIDEAVAIAERIARDDLVPDLQHTRALVAIDRGDRSDGVAALEEAVRLKRPRLDDAPPLAVLNSFGQLGLQQLFDGHLDEAATVLEEGLAASRRRLGDHVQTSVFLDYLGQVRLEQGAAPEAESLVREGLTMLLPALSPDHRRPVAARRLLGRSLLAQGRLDEAERVLRRSLTAQRGDAWTPASADWLTEIVLAEVWAAQGHGDRALNLADANLARFDRDPERTRWYRVWDGGLLRLGRAAILQQAGRTDAARRDLERARADAFGVYGARCPIVTRADAALARLIPQR
ncbi:MAG: protein kinase [Myxococcota bacterium]